MKCVEERLVPLPDEWQELLDEQVGEFREEEWELRVYQTPAGTTPCLDELERLLCRASSSNSERSEQQLMDKKTLKDLLADKSARHYAAAGAAAVAFGELVCVLMEKANMTQADIARELGVEPSTVSRRLSGDVDPRLSSVAELLSVLGVSLDAEFTRIAKGRAEPAFVASRVVPFAIPRPKRTTPNEPPQVDMRTQVN